MAETKPETHELTPAEIRIELVEIRETVRRELAWWERKSAQFSPEDIRRDPEDGFGDLLLSTHTCRLIDFSIGRALDFMEAIDDEELRKKLPKLERWSGQASNHSGEPPRGGWR